MNRTMRTPALVVLSTLVSIPLARAAPPGVTFDPGTRLRFAEPLSLPQAVVSEAVAAQNDPLSVQNGLSLYVQGGRVVAPEQVGFGAPYCRVDVELGKLSAASDHADGQRPIPISGPELLIVTTPLRGNPHNYGRKEVKIGERGQHLVESKWTPTGAVPVKGAASGTSLEFRFRPEPDSSIVQILCAKKGAEPPGVSDFLKVFGKLATLAAPEQAASTAEDDRKAAARAKSVGSNRVEVAAPAQDSPATPQSSKDRLKEYEEARKARKPVKAEKGEFDTMMESPPASDGGVPDAPAATSKKLGGGFDWLSGQPEPAAVKKGKKTKK